MKENFLVSTSYNKKKFKMGNNKVNEKTKIWKLFNRILDKLLSGINPPEEIVVKAKLKESSNLKSIKLYKKIINTVVDIYIKKILIKLELKLL